MRCCWPLAEAPDAIRDRFVAWQKVTDDEAVKDDARFALAASGYVLGADAAVVKLDQAAELEATLTNFATTSASSDAGERASTLNQLQTICVPERTGQASPP